MAGKSTIAKLPEPILLEVNAALKRNATIDEIVWMLKGLGQDVSRSAVGRYTKQYTDLAARQRDMSSIAKAFASEFGEADDQQGRLLIQLATTIATRMVLPIAAGDDPELATKSLMELGRAVKDITSAAKIDVDREAKIRSEAKQRAANDAERAAKAAGATPETIDRIKASILGISR